MELCEEMEKYVREITNNPRLDRSIATFDNNIALYSTPNSAYIGVVIKKAFDNPASQELLDREASALTEVGKVLKKHKWYCVPKVIQYDPSNHVIVMQRLYGPTALEVALQIPKEGEESFRKIAQWLSIVHGSSRDETGGILGETTTFKKFESLLSQDESKGFPETKALQDLLQRWEKCTYSRTSFLHGDVSPIHFYFEPDGIYAIDLNGARVGPPEEDLGSFISNCRWHISEIGQCQQLIETFMEEYRKKESCSSRLINFYGGFFDYLKARNEPNPQLLMQKALNLIPKV